MEQTQLRVIKPDRRLTDLARLEELRVEIIARLDESDDFLEMGGVVLDEWRANMTKQRHLNALARAEIMSLGGPHDAA